jgi:nicotinamidase-related amidase
MEPRKDTALLVMDIQAATSRMLADSESFFKRVNQVIHAARNRSMPVIYIVIGFRKGFPDANPAGRSFSILKEMNLDTEEGMRVHPSVAPHPADVIIVKKRVSAFSGSDLEVILRSLGIKNLVLTGIATSGVVLSTLREASDKDFGLTVISDCCADRDEEVHRVLTTKVFVRQADVVTAEAWCR